MKEQQYNKIIAALKQTAEENANKRKEMSDEKDKGLVNPNQQDWKDTLDELSSKKQEVNDLQEKVLDLELKAEKAALDFKIQL